jgi:UDP-glucose 4,6-dehydratase
MRLLITGGCGFLGSHLVEHFLKSPQADDIQIIVLDKLTYASRGYDRLRHVRAGMAEAKFENRVQMLGCDLSRPIPEGIAQELGPVDYIIHAAAESHVDNSIVDPLPFLESNVLGTHHLLMLARTIPSLRRIFVVSTDEVYGPAPRKGYGTFLSPALEAFTNSALGLIDVLSKAGGYQAQCERLGLDLEEYKRLSAAVYTARTAVSYTGFGEEARSRPANPYAASKAGAEAIAIAYANTYRLPITIVNTMNLIGERQHPEKFVPLVIRKVLAGEPVTIHADPTRTHAGTRFYLHCRTFANALGWLIADPGRSPQTLAEYQGSGPPPPSPLKLHVCGEREISNLELAEMIAGIVGKPLSYELVDFHSSRPGHDLRYAMDDSLIRDMGWVRPMNLEQSLAKTVQWYLNNPTWLHPA